jgi:hypothetical protein
LTSPREVTKLYPTELFPSFLTTTFALELRRSPMGPRYPFHITNVTKSMSKGLPPRSSARMVSRV